VSEDAAAEPTFVYHRVPANLRGSTLYPLNQLREVHPNLYERLQKNYATRRDIAALRIPPLGSCLWNDVLFFSPVHPADHEAALKAAGHWLPPEWRRYFRIDANLIHSADAVIYESRTIFWSGAFDIGEASAILGSECRPFHPRSLAPYTHVPARASDYYATVPPGTRFPLFLHMPHILYKRRIDLSLPGIEVNEV
jgi:hypothetical protein